MRTILYNNFFLFSYQINKTPLNTCASPSQSNVEFTGKFIPDCELEVIYLLVSQSPLHGSESEPVALAGPAFLISEGVNALHFFHKITAHFSCNRMHIIFLETSEVVNPEGDVLDADRVFAEWLEMNDLAALELRQEASILAPEQTDVRYVEQLHGEPLKPQAGSPAHLPRIDVGVFENLWVNNTTAQHLQPFAFVEDFKLKTWVGEGESCIKPAHLNISEQVLYQALQSLLKVASSLGDHDIVLCVDKVLFIKDPDCLHLVEYWVVVLVDLVASVYIAKQNELPFVFGHGGHLMGRGMGPEDCFLVDVISVGSLA